MNIILSAAFILLFCIDYYTVYNEVVKRNVSLTQRQKAHIMSIKVSITLFLLSLYFNYKFMTSESYIDELNSGDLFFINLTVLYVISYFIMDCLVGYFEYHKYLCSLSGYTHHIVYTFISLLSINYNVASSFILYFIEELPTYILSIGNYHSHLRSDNLFGITFLMTRIIYHCYLIIYTYTAHPLFIILGFLSFCLHSYWFKNWLNKYFLKNKKD